MSHSLIAVIGVAILFFVAGLLVMRKHAARIEAAVVDLKSHAEQASYSIKSDAMKVTAAASAAQAGMAKAADDVKAALTK